MQGDKNYSCRIIQLVLNYDEEEEMFFFFLFLLFVEIRINPEEELVTYEGRDQSSQKSLFSFNFFLFVTFLIIAPSAPLPPLPPSIPQIKTEERRKQSDIVYFF
jgi:hypothetical protein